MASISINAPGATGFIYNNANLGTARVCVSAETPDFDTETLRAWADEGFDVVYAPYNNGGKEYEARLKSVKDGLGVGDNYAVIGEYPTLYYSPICHLSGIGVELTVGVCGV